MSETREVFEMVTKHSEPDIGSWKDQERHQRKRAQRRRAGAFAVVAGLIVASGVGFALTNGGALTSGIADQPTPTAPATGTPRYGFGLLGLMDLTTGEITRVEILPDASAIDVSPDGSQIAYIDGAVVNIADLDGSDARALEETRGDLAGPQWSPDGSSIVYQGGMGGLSIGNLYVIDVTSGQVSQITETEAVETENLYYMSPTFDPTGTTVMFHMPTGEGDRERFDLWSVPVTGGELTLVRRSATFGDYSPDGTQIAFVEDRDSPAALFVVPAAGGDVRKVATDASVVPRWSPDGTRIVYNDGSGRVYVVDVETGVKTLVVETSHLPAWVDEDPLTLTP
jgi:TolB protein